MVLEISGPSSAPPPPDPAGLFSDGAEVIQLLERSLTIPRTGIKRVSIWGCSKELKHWGRIGRIASSYPILGAVSWGIVLYDTREKVRTELFPF